ncbi:hypothetical protein AAHA92_22068 [Salvia divinorum]|uniref:Uncharacterized protein n=1 Tax=Salvia divinorum TaxID=28513 RepID=A0ABD1GMS1_SALDI
MGAKRIPAPLSLQWTILYSWIASLSMLAIVSCYQSTNPRNLENYHASIVKLLLGDHSDIEGAYLIYLILLMERVKLNMWGSKPSQLHDPCLFVNNLRGADAQCPSAHVMFNAEKDELDSVTMCMEDQLTSVGILGSIDDTLSSTLFSKNLKGINLDTRIGGCWQSRSHSSKHVLPWICCILVCHSSYIKSMEPKFLDSLYKLVKAKAPAMDSLLQLSGRLQLVSAQNLMMSMMMKVKMKMLMMLFMELMTILRRAVMVMIRHVCNRKIFRYTAEVIETAEIVHSRLVILGPSCCQLCVAYTALHINSWRWLVRFISEPGSHMVPVPRSTVAMIKRMMVVDSPAAVVVVHPVPLLVALPQSVVAPLADSWALVVSLVAAALPQEPLMERDRGREMEIEIEIER